MKRLLGQKISTQVREKEFKCYVTKGSISGGGSKKSRSSERDFFIQRESGGIYHTVMCVYHCPSGRISSRFSVYFPLSHDEIQRLAPLMIYKTYGFEERLHNGITMARRPDAQR